MAGHSVPHALQHTNTHTRTHNTNTRAHTHTHTNTHKHTPCFRELKRRMDELEAELKEAKQSDAKAAVVALEGRIKQVGMCV